MPRPTEQDLIDKLQANSGDSAERRRILGILAQRRYRRRQRQKSHNDTSGESKSRPRQISDQVSRPSCSTTEDFGTHQTTANFLASSTEELAPYHFDFSDLQIENDALPDHWFNLALETVDIVAGHEEHTSPAASIEHGTSGSQALYRMDSNHGAFSDESRIQMPGIGLVKGHVTILSALLRAVGLDCGIDTIWNPFAPSPFHANVHQPSTLDSLPPHYAPTSIQKAQPHHPVFDLFPWPSVRDKFLMILSLPAEARPQKAQGEIHTVVMSLKYDMMEAAEGMKIHGEDPFDAGSWEVGQTVFQGWWWAFDNDILLSSNALRKRRGAEEVRISRPVRH